MARALKKLLGIFTLLMGASIVVWFIYNQFAPTPDFERSYTSFIQLAVPLAMIWVGWRWLTARPAERARRYPHFVMAKIHVPISELEHGRKYAESLQDSLEERELGQVSDRGQKPTEDGKVAWLELAIELAKFTRGSRVYSSAVARVGSTARFSLRVPGRRQRYRVADH